MFTFASNLPIYVLALLTIVGIWTAVWLARPWVQDVDEDYNPITKKGDSHVPPSP